MIQRMKIVLLVSGKTETVWLQQGIDVYMQRLKYYIPFEIKVIPDLKNTKNLTSEEQKEKEGKLILPYINEKSDVYLLDEGGQEYSSKELAVFLDKKMITGCRELTFVIGGPFGFSTIISEKTAGKISLSRLTFSHQMVRLLFAEQLYRAFTILRGEPYHHE
jgi:23S rRNA (pseudouridine1915-N3)-methyltransferase